MENGKNMQMFGGSKDKKSVILLVDDENVVLDVGTKMLQHLGYNVLGAENGREAIDLFRKNKNWVELVILDMNMPGMNGATVYDHLKKIQTDAKVLIASGYFENHVIGDILKNGCIGFIQKPFTIGELSEKLKEMLNKK